MAQLSKEQAEQIEGLKGKHGNVGYIGLRGHLVVVRPPSLGESQRYHDCIAKSFVAAPARGRPQVSLSESKRTYALDCIVLPESREQARALIDPIGFAAYDRLVDKIEALSELEIEDFEGN